MKVKPNIEQINARIRRKAEAELGTEAGALFFSITALPTPGGEEGQMTSACALINTPDKISSAIAYTMTGSPVLTYIILHAATYYMAQHVTTRLETELPPPPTTQQ